MCALEKKKLMITTKKTDIKNMESKNNFAAEERIVTVSVETYLYKFITESLDCEVVRLERDSTLLAIMRQHLELESQTAETDDVPEGYCELKIQLPELRKVYNNRTKQIIYCNTLFRTRLSDKGVKRVRNFFKRTFKNSLHTFIDGYTESQNDSKTHDNEKTKVKQGVTAFLLQYHIDFDEKLIRSLVRDWYRHVEKNEKNRFTPVTY